MPGGVIVACDYRGPPSSGPWEVDAAFEHLESLPTTDAALPL
jgi:hypothetical protein